MLGFGVQIASSGCVAKIMFFSNGLEQADKSTHGTINSYYFMTAINTLMIHPTLLAYLQIYAYQSYHLPILVVLPHPQQSMLIH